MTLKPYTPYSAYNYDPAETTHKLIGFLYEGLNTRHYISLHGFLLFEPYTLYSTRI